MSNKDNAQPTIAELMAADLEQGQEDAALFRNPELVRTAAKKAAETGGDARPFREDEAEATSSESGASPDAVAAAPVKTPPPVSLLPRLREQNMLVDGSDLGAEYYDQYRRIKRPLLSNAFGKTASLVEHGNRILVTSSIPGEGKTHTSINLALSMAQERDHTVLLVDVDLTRYGTSRQLGTHKQKGIVDVIEDDLDLAEVILKTDIPRLSLLPAGRQHPFVTELLASHRMAELVNEIGQRYDDRVILFDGPPILSTPQTQILTELVGQVVFVVEAAKTPQHVVDDALDLIPEDMAAGIVLNKSEGKIGRGGYYYGYYGSPEKE